jgi:N-acetylglutamate synthase-like GNAT family acetyltransferase
VIAVRRAEREDVDGILACLHAAFEPYRTSYTPDAFADTVLTPGTLGERLDAMQVFVAIADHGAVVGTIACSVVGGGGEGHLRGMAVLPDWQGRGAAAALLAAAESHLAARGCTHVTLDTTLPLVRAASFYTTRGYRSSGRSSDFFGMPLVEFIKTI